MPRIIDMTDKFFNRDAASPLSELVPATKTEPDGKIDLSKFQSSDFRVNGLNVFMFLDDRGRGRIWEGLRSLELMSNLIKGVSTSSIQLFDNQIIAHSPGDMVNATDALAMVIVNDNIGITDILTFAKANNPREVLAYETFAATVARQVRAGGFKAEDNIEQALVRVKALAKSVKNTKVAN